MQDSSMLNGDEPCPRRDSNTRLTEIRNLRLCPSELRGQKTKSTCTIHIENRYVKTLYGFNTYETLFCGYQARACFFQRAWFRVLRSCVKSSIDCLFFHHDFRVR